MTYDPLLDERIPQATRDAARDANRNTAAPAPRPTNPRADWRQHWRAEAVLIIPADALDTLATVRVALTDAFGGLTETLGFGAWKNSAGRIVRDEVAIFTVAVPSLFLSRDRGGVVSHETERLWYGAEQVLYAVARTACKTARQDCIYLRMPDGRVFFVTADGPDYDGFQHGGYTLAAGINHSIR